MKNVRASHARLTDDIVMITTTAHPPPQPNRAAPTPSGPNQESEIHGIRNHDRCSAWRLFWRPRHLFSVQPMIGKNGPAGLRGNAGRLEHLPCLFSRDTAVRLSVLARHPDVAARLDRVESRFSTFWCSPPFWRQGTSRSRSCSGPAAILAQFDDNPAFRSTRHFVQVSRACCHAGAGLGDGGTLVQELVCVDRAFAVQLDPYFLYAASNAGSLLALLAYPFVVEPNFWDSPLSVFSGRQVF